MFYPLTSRLIMIAGLFAALVLAGCGGGGDSGVENTLRQERDMLEDEVEDLEIKLEAAQDDLTEAEEAKETAEGLAKDAAEDLVDAQSGTADAIASAQRERDEARRQAQTLEANQRAEKLKAAFPSDTGLTAITATDSPVDITVPTKANGSLTLTGGGYGTATLSGSGTRSATMDLTSGTDSGKAVVYTDPELSKPLLEYFGSLRDPNDMTRFELGADTDLALGTVGVIFQTSTQWEISVPISLVPKSVDTDPAEDPADPGTLPSGVNNDPKTPGDFYAGSLYGLSGRFVCGGENCQVQVKPTYALEAVNNQHALVSVAVTSVIPDQNGFQSGGTLYFKPSGSPSLQLYEGGPVGADAEYMAFGYWREDPTSPAADYKVGVFAQAFRAADSATIPTGGVTATYDGTAVGMYVEQDPNDAVDTHRQGEFTADVDLIISNGNPVTGLTGTIDDFVTTPTGGSAAPRTSARWVVRLRDMTDTNDPTAVIDNLTGVKSGSWEYTPVPAHRNASDTTPPAVTGTFNTRILDFVHLLGAFGADKR